MARSTLAVSPLSETPRPTPQGETDSSFYEGSLIDGIIGVVEKARQPKPPQTFEIPTAIPTDDARRERNAAMLLDLCRLGEQMLTQTGYRPIEGSDALRTALNGFPDVNTYYNYRDCDR